MTNIGHSVELPYVKINSNILHFKSLSKLFFKSDSLMLFHAQSKRFVSKHETVNYVSRIDIPQKMKHFFFWDILDS